MRHGNSFQMSGLRVLSPRLLEILRNYWRAVRPKQWLFEGYVAGQPITRDAVHRVLGNHPKPAIHNHLKTGQR